MRVKIGDTWHEAEPGKPIMFELTETDAENVGAMLEHGGRKYAIFHDADSGTTYKDRGDYMSWMDDESGGNVCEHSDMAAFSGEVKD